MKFVHCPACREPVPNTDFRFDIEDNEGHDVTRCPHCSTLTNTREWARTKNIHTAGQQADLGAY